ncbi:MAG TPA: hypothetical protein VMF58_13680 [Rhizomicrobium sp.]|nr:hypothetical protein [Rhizomicrobium sp.]
MRLISTLAFLAFASTAALAQSGSATVTVTGAVDTSKNRTSATEAKEDTKAGNKQAISPANAGNQAAQQSAPAGKPKASDNDSKPH